TRRIPRDEPEPTWLNASTNEDARGFADELCTRGLLVRAETEEDTTPRESALSHRCGDEELIPWSDMRCPRIRISDIARFVRAVLTALFLIRMRPFDEVVTRCACRHS